MTTTRTMQEIRADYDAITEKFWTELFDPNKTEEENIAECRRLELPFQQELSAWFIQNTPTD